MLQYDGEDHMLNYPINKKDLTIRVTQFFDHYLNGTAPPKWMTRGIPAEMKGVESRYDRDSEGSCSFDCKICLEKRYDVSASSKNQTW
jgi:hypothetical protein